MMVTYWHELWGRTEIRFHQQEVDVHLGQFFNRPALRSGLRVLMPLCGKDLAMNSRV